MENGIDFFPAIIAIITIGLGIYFFIKANRKYYYEEPEDKKIIRLLTRQIKSKEKISVPLSMIAELSWLKNEEEKNKLPAENERKNEKFKKEEVKKEEKEEMYSQNILQEVKRPRVGEEEEIKEAEIQVEEPGEIQQHLLEEKEERKEEPVEADEIIPACVQELFEYDNKEVLEFFESYIEPIYPTLIKNKTLEVIVKILTFLSAKGDVPSVVNLQDKDSDYTYAFLKKVSLTQHSIDTAKEGLKILKEEYSFNYDIIVDKYLVIFLGHDLGKAIPGKNYASQDHPILSAQILSNIIPDDISWKKDVLEVVKKHHFPIVEDNKDPLNTLNIDLKILQTADRRARELEIERVTDQGLIEEDADNGKLEEKEQENEKEKKVVERDEIVENAKQTRTEESEERNTEEDTVTETLEKKGPQGIMPSDVFKIILPVVNKLITANDIKNPNLPIPRRTPEGNFIAVSQPDGIVYVRPDVIYEAVMILIRDKKLQKENAALLAQKKNQALIEIVLWLMDNNCIPPGHVKKGYFGRYYKYAFKDDNELKKALFTPLIIQAFGVMPGELEQKRKEVTKLSSLTIKKTRK